MMGNQYAENDNFTQPIGSILHGLINTILSWFMLHMKLFNSAIIFFSFHIVSV